jgi:hypothetical protein
MAKRLRIVFHMAPDMRLPREIMEEAFAANGFTVIGEHGADPLGSMRDTGADALIVRADSCDEDEIGDLLAKRPGARVLAIAPNGGTGALYELRPHRVYLGDVSPQSLIDAIRGDAE